jgi:hypothetical protein
VRIKRVLMDVTRRLLVAADRVRRPADRGVGKRRSGDTGDDDEEDDLVVEAERVDLSQTEKGGIVARLDFKGDVFAAGQAKDHAATDEQRGQRRDEGRRFQDGEQAAVDQPIARPMTRHRDTAIQMFMSKYVGAKLMPKIVAVRSKVDPTDRSSSLLTMTKVMPIASTP